MRCCWFDVVGCCISRARSSSRTVSLQGPSWVLDLSADDQIDGDRRSLREVAVLNDVQIMSGASVKAEHGRAIIS